MARSDIVTKILGTGGINQQERLADPVLELADARNLWAPTGKLEKRPGFIGIGAICGAATKSAVGSVYLSEDANGALTETQTLDSKPVYTRWYFGTSEDLYSTRGAGLQLRATTANTTDMNAVVEYWNGFSWVGLNYAAAASGVQVAGTPNVYAYYTSIHLGELAAHYYFPWPGDTELLTLAGYSRYWFRFTLVHPTSTTLSATVNGVEPIPLKTDISANIYSLRYVVAAQFPTTQRFIRAFSRTNSGVVTGAAIFTNSPKLSGTADNVAEDALANSSFYYLDDEPASAAIIPEFGEVYIAYNYTTTVHKAQVTSDTTTVMDLARAEDDQTLVGPDATYDQDFVSQTGWPESKYLVYHRGEMWAANLRNAPQQVRWSAGTSLVTPGYKIWPQLNTETLADKDQSPVTGLFPWQDSVLVFKSDSIWQMVYTGQNALGLNTYRAEKIVSGSGCVSNSSIQDIKGNLVFLGEDGVYNFDGVKATKISDRVQEYINKVLPGRRAFAQSLHWKEKSCYLLAFTANGSSVNNLLLVWDYKNNSWWVWDNIEAVQMFKIEGQSGQEELFFADRAGRTFKIGVGVNDHGVAISGTATTQRINQDNVNQKLRAVVILGTNLSREVTLEAQPNDKPFLDQDTITFTFRDSNEKEYKQAQYEVNQYTEERERFIGVGELKSGEWFRLKLTHDEQYAPMSISEIRISVVPTGVRN